MSLLAPASASFTTSTPFTGSTSFFESSQLLFVGSWKRQRAREPTQSPRNVLLDTGHFAMCCLTQNTLCSVSSITLRVLLPKKSPKRVWLKGLLTAPLFQTRPSPGDSSLQIRRPKTCDHVHVLCAMRRGPGTLSKSRDRVWSCGLVGGLV